MSNDKDAKQLWEGIQDKPYCDPKKRMDFVLVFDVKDGNPNGDPDAGNLPRMDPATRHGIVTDVCIKRKIRDYLAAALRRPIYIQSEQALNTLYFRAAKQEPSAEKYVMELSISDDDLRAILTSDVKGVAKPPSGEDVDKVRGWLESVDAEGLEYQTDKLSYFGEAKSRDSFKQLLQGEQEAVDLPEKAIDKIADALAKAKKDKGGAKLGQDVREAVKTRMCKEYDDIRLFGAVLTAGTNAGQIRGPMQLTFGRSTEPILQMDAAITRCAITRAADLTRKQTEFGRKPWLSWAVYRQHGFFNPLLAEKTGVTREDLARFWEALAGMFPNSASASKGEMAMRDIVVFVHENPRGNCPSHILMDSVRMKRKTVHGKGAQGEHTEDAAENAIQERVFADVWEVKHPENEHLPQGVSVEHPLGDLWPSLQC